ncbi:hypothetical protein AB1484_12505 [Parafrankia sp. FMc6]|uniref:hypothetical protein n=1 Tax=Parafrankia soli TaxID=2599596 RepID=UPI0034D3D496
MLAAAPEHPHGRGEEGDEKRIREIQNADSTWPRDVDATVHRCLRPDLPPPA